MTLSTGLCVQVLLYKETSDDIYKKRVENILRWWMLEAPRNPNCRQVMFDEWGSLRHANNIALVALMAAESGIQPHRYRDFAQEQVSRVEPR